MLLLSLCCTGEQCIFLRHISYVFIVYKVPDKPSHIPQAYQNAKYRLAVQHKNMSIREILLRKPYFNMPRNCTTERQKTMFQLRRTPVTSNHQIISGNMKSWKVACFGHASKGQNNSRINDEIRSSLSRKRITVSLQYCPDR